MRDDLRQALRSLCRQPAFAAAAIATFALGIGSATAMFSVAYGLAFRPLPFPAADRLVRVYEANTATNESRHQVSLGTFQAWREMVSSLEGLALFGRASLTYTPEAVPRPVTIMGVSPRFFDVLGVRPIRGRAFNAEAEYGRSRPVELVISYDAWLRLFGGDEQVVGRTFQLSERGAPARIIGVMPRGFTFDAPVDAWRPVVVELPVARLLRSWRYDRVVARLRAGRSIDDVRGELATASSRLAREFPATNAGWTTTVEPLRDAIIGRFGAASWLLLAAVGAVLLVACANVAGLLTARALERTRDTHIRIALGASRWRVVRTGLAEALLLAAGGAAIGVGAAWWLVRLLRAAAPPGLPRVQDIAVDAPALGVACAATLVGAGVCSLVTLLGRHDRGLSSSLHASSGRSGDGPSRRRAGTALVAVQCAAALALVVASVVFARSFLRLTAVDLGWQPDRVLSLHVSPRMPPENRRPWFLYVQWAERLVARLEATPGIARAAVTTTIPFSPETYRAEIARGRDRAADETRWPIGLHMVTPHYFATLGLTLVRGRLFTDDDRFDEATLTARAEKGTGVAIVTESVARALWPGVDPIGQPFRVPGNDGVAYREVVGIVRDVQYTSVGDEPALNVFLPWSQNPTGLPRLVVRATGDAAGIPAAVRSAVLAEHAATGIDRVMPLASLVDRSTAPARLTSAVMAAFGGLALVLAAVGVYGSLSTLVHARSREIAVRIALGASPAATLRRTLAAGLVPVAIGAVIGAGVAAAAVAAARSLLFGVDRVDPASLTAGIAIVLVVTAAACLAPAVRASRTDPLAVLRGE